MLYNRNAIFTGGVRPHWYCLPILKREVHRQALVEAATSGSPRFFLGTDSAPHARGLKEHACGCAGCYAAPACNGALRHRVRRGRPPGSAEGFANFHGPDFLRPAAQYRYTLTLRREAYEIPAEVAFGDTTLLPLAGGESLGWRALA